MADETKKLNSMRALEQQHIDYETHAYDSTITNGVLAAEAMGFPPAQVYKTLVVQIEKGQPALVMIPSDRKLDLKKFARAIGQKKAIMTTKRGAEAATGLKTGGIGALALTHKRWGVYLDQPDSAYDAILVNAGQRGLNLKVKVADLVRILNAKVLTEISDPLEDTAEADDIADE